MNDIDKGPKQYKTLEPDVFLKSMELLKSHKNREALTFLDNQLKVNPNNIVIWYLKSIAYDQLDDFHETYESFEKVVIKNEHVIAKNDIIKLLDQFDEIIKTFSYELKAFNIRWELMARLRDTENFLHFLIQHLQIVEKAVKHHDKAKEYGIGYKVVWEKMDSFLKSLSLVNDEIISSQKNSTPEHIILHAGTTFDQFGIYEQIIQCCKFLLKQGVKSTCLYNNMGISLSNELKTDEAIDEFNNALDLDQDYLPSLNNIGVITNSIEEFEKVIEKDNQNITAKYNKAFYFYGNINWEKDQIEEALNLCINLLNIISDDKDSWYLHGLINESLGNQVQALESYNRALEIAPKNVEILTTHGELLIKMENYEKALESLDRATELEPGDMYIWEEKVKIYQKLKNEQGELNCYNTMIEHGNYAPALLGKGRILINKGELDKAIKLLDQLYGCMGQDVLWPQGMFHKARAEAIRNNKKAMIENLKDAFRATVWFNSFGNFSKKKLIEFIENSPEFDKFRNSEEFKAILTHDWEHETDDELEKFYKK